MLLPRTADAQEFSNFILFGGSYSDAGTYLVADSDGDYVLDGQTFDQRRWTINPAPVWNQYVGSNYGFDIDANLVVDTTSDPNDPVTEDNGGTNYAQGGAPVTGPGAYEYNTLALDTQIGAYFASTGGDADPNALYSIQAGANTIINAVEAIVTFNQTIAQAKASIEDAANTAADLAVSLAEAGAEHILIMDTNNLADVPGAPNLQILNDFVRDSVENYNDILLARLLATGRDDFIYIDTFGFLKELGTNGASYGFTNTTDTACTTPIVASFELAINCTEDTLNPGVDPATYLWDGGLHPSGTGHLALAQYVQSVLSAPGQYGFLAEVPLILGQGAIGVVDRRLIGADLRARGTNLFLQGTAGHVDLSGNGPGVGAVGVHGGVYAGLEYVFGPNVLAGLIGGYNGGSFDFPADSGQFDMNLYSGTVYASVSVGNGFVRAAGSYGWVDYSSVERSFAVHQGRVTNHGETDGTYAAGSVRAGYNFVFGPHAIVPSAALTYQRVKVDGFTERGKSWSTMMFNDQTREAFYGSFGARFESTISTGEVDIYPWLETSYHHDFEDGSRNIVSGLTAAEGLKFAMPFDPGLEDWFTIEGGIQANVLGDASLALTSGVRVGENDVDNFWASLTVSVPLN